MSFVNKFLLGSLIALSLSIAGNAIQYYRTDAKIEHAQSEITIAKNESAFYRTQLAICKAGQDTIHGQGHVDTVKIISKPLFSPVVKSMSTVPIDTTNTQSWVSTVEIDTSKSFGDTCNPVNVRVWAKVWPTGKYDMLIQPSYRPLVIKELETKWEKTISIGAGIVGQKMTAGIGLSVNRGRTGLWLMPTISEKANIGLLSGFSMKF
jgi:hypothetical protein